MAKLCEGCGFYTADNAPSACPDCSAALKFTFLPPAGKAAAPIAGLPTNATDELNRRHRAGGGSRINWLLVKGVGAALVTITIAGVRFYFKQEAREEREAQETASVERVRPGMHISEAARLLEGGSNMPRWHGSTRSEFDADDDSDGTMELNDGRNDVKVTWRNGYVVSVERAAGGGGTRQRAARTTTGPDVEADGVADGPDRPVVHPAERLIAQPGSGR
ncbi:hypothetical protein [Urbifossiella limnaea]|uniref:Uncharacterized protein n=1 Tax=Urbifossiella limnaea TaxID=2528023 RepID=A0A517Y3H0_9BACT|nr:hypothetical protein [Urbifossiella limnaea]QDU24353.1 hypothetical protein ETAA1_63680 [Urbifossiella limnaea]